MDNWMDNWELHRKELENIIAEHLAVKRKTGEPVDCSNINCKDCLFNGNQCIKDSIRWLNKGDE